MFFQDQPPLDEGRPRKSSIAPRKTVSGSSGATARHQSYQACVIPSPRSPLGGSSMRENRPPGCPRRQSQTLPRSVAKAYATPGSEGAWATAILLSKGSS